MRLDRWRGARDAAPAAIAPGTASPPLLLAYIGPLVHESGIGELVRGLHLARRHGARARLVIAGSGEHEACLQGMAGRLGLAPAIDFRGPVFAAARVQLLRGVDISVLPHGEAGLLHALNCSLVAGVPVIARRSGTPSDAIIEGLRGLLLAGGGADEYAGAILRLAADQRLLERMRTACRGWRGPLALA